MDNARIERAPYSHELNGQGTACAEDCPACRWVAGQNQRCSCHDAYEVGSGVRCPVHECREVIEW